MEVVIRYREGYWCVCRLMAVRATLVPYEHYWQAVAHCRMRGFRVLGVERRGWGKGINPLALIGG